ncbi:Vacuolar fusion protein CCZ1 like [Verticillium longisporum]|nr:Vacuolar fusion protein CCZ1 like [Verticillium longisporum]
MASPGGIVPAQLGFLAIFNPSLGITDETIDDQIVYYASVTTQRHKRRHRSRGQGRPTENVSQEERNERLRQIGLAQGMVDFGKSFSGGQPVDTIDTEKSRVVLHEIESGWWALVSIELTKIPLPPKLPTGKTGEPVEEVAEYSSKEIKPATLLLQDLLRAHSTFLLHHGFSLSSLFVRTGRPKFVSILTRYWDWFLSTWNVMLQGNPTRSLLGSINIAASSELGIGVGEEERGSGERDVLEGLVGRIEGLQDLIISRFGSNVTDLESSDGSTAPWLGTGREPGPDDGAIFLGTIGTVAEARTPDVPTPSDESPTDGSKDADGHLDRFMTYMKLGYGTYWSIGKSDEQFAQDADKLEGESAVSAQAPAPKKVADTTGHYLIGLLGDVEESSASEGDDSGEHGDADKEDSNARTMLRTVHVELEKAERDLSESQVVKNIGSLVNEITPIPGVPASSASTFTTHSQNKTKKMRIVVYVNKPFIYTFLFELRTDSLSWESFYRNLHRQLVPLQKPLLASTKYRPERPSVGAAGTSIYDVIWDPTALTAINTHMQLLNMYALTRRNVTELERTSQSQEEAQTSEEAIIDEASPSTEDPAASESSADRLIKKSPAPEPRVDKEIFLIRRASDHASSRGFSGTFAETGSSWGEGAGRLASGIGVDTRKYIEGLLSLNR